MLCRIPIEKSVFISASFIIDLLVTFVEGKQNSNHIVLLSILISVLSAEFLLVFSSSILNFCVLSDSFGALGDIFSYSQNLLRFLPPT